MPPRIQIAEVGIRLLLFFFNDTPTPEIYTLSLHDALPISVAGPLEDGRTALVIRIHHCLADGVSGLRMLSQLLWDSEDGNQPLVAQAWHPEPVPGKARLLAAGAGSRMRGIGGAVASGARAAASPRRWLQGGRELAAL